mgnify:CR=1 FL=1
MPAAILAVIAALAPTIALSSRRVNAPKTRGSSYESHLAAAVEGAWSDAVPTIVLQALWARGDVAPVYAMAGALPPSRRPLMLAWLAGQDPQPGAAHVDQAARDALRQAQDGWTRMAVIALVPLAEHPELAALARRMSDWTGRVALDLRAGGDPPGRLDLHGRERALADALRAVALAELGRPDEAAAALAEALREPPYDPAAELARLPALARLDAWEHVPSSSLNTPSLLWAAFLAGRAGLAAAERLIDLRKNSTLRVPAALGAGDLPDEWRESFARNTEAHLEDVYCEGLIDADERWVLRVGAALAGPDAHAAVEARVLAAIVEAHAAARGFADPLTARGGVPDDADARARNSQRLRKLLDAPHDETLPSYRTLRRFVQPARRLADADGARDVRDVVDALERRFGPADRWGRGDYHVDDMTVCAAAELLACAEGRALAALRLVADDPGAPPAETRARICAGLARDGHLDALREPFERLLAGPLDPGDVALLWPAARALDPSAEDRRTQALEQAVAALPATAEAARAWLGECDHALLRAARRRREPSPG